MTSSNRRTTQRVRAPFPCPITKWNRGLPLWVSLRKIIKHGQSFPLINTEEIWGRRTLSKLLCKWNFAQEQRKFLDFRNFTWYNSCNKIESKMSFTINWNLLDIYICQAVCYIYRCYLICLLDNVHPILQMRTLRLKKGKYFSLKSGAGFTPEPQFLTMTYVTILHQWMWLTRPFLNSCHQNPITEFF